MVSSWRLHAALFKFTGWPATLEEPHESAWSERYDWGRGQSAEEGNTAAGAEDHACSVPLQSASCKTPSHGENTFKHTPFSPLNNINRAQHSVSFWCISQAPLAPLFQTKRWCHVFWSEEGAWVSRPALSISHLLIKLLVWLDISTITSKHTIEPLWQLLKKPIGKIPGINKPNINQILRKSFFFFKLNIFDCYSYLIQENKSI